MPKGVRVRVPPLAIGSAGIDVNDEWGKLAGASGVLAVGGAAAGALALVLAVPVLALPETSSPRTFVIFGAVGLLCGAGVGRLSMWLCGFCGEVLLIPVTAAALACLVLGFWLPAPDEPWLRTAVVWWALAIWFGGAFVVTSERWR